MRKNTTVSSPNASAVQASAGVSASRVEGGEDEIRYHAIADMTTKSTAAERTRVAAEPGMLVLLCAAAWLIPGAGHLWMGRRQKGLVFLLALPAMFAIGLLLHGRVFPFEFSEPLVARAAADGRHDVRRVRRGRARARLVDVSAAAVTDILGPVR